MIRINLLPVKRKKKTQPLPPFIIYGVIILVVTLLGLGFFTYNLFGKVASKKSERITKQKTLEELEAKLEEVKNFERDNALFQKKNKAIEDLKRKQKAPLVLLDEVSAHLPEGVWLTGMNDKGGSIEIKGYAFSNTELVTYVQSLKKSKNLTGVTLMESKQKKIGNVSVYQFILKIMVTV
jgi:type IV pilus assembly protein PilN